MFWTVAVLFFWPVLVIWAIWKKTKLSDTAKWITSIVFVGILVLLIGISLANSPDGNTNQATNSDGNSSQNTIQNTTSTRAINGPKIQIESPTASQIVDAPTKEIEVKGSVTPMTAVVTVNGVAATVESTTGKFVAKVAIPLGTSKVIIKAKDADTESSEEVAVERTITYAVAYSSGKGVKRIVIAPTYMTEEIMTALGEKLKQETSNDNFAKISVFTDKKAADLMDAEFSGEISKADDDYYVAHYVAEYQKNTSTGNYNYRIFFDGVTGSNIKQINY